MSLYINESADHFDECMKSVLSNSILPNEIVIVFDGPISEELNETVNKYVAENPSLYKLVKLETNQGLGLALREGVLHCSNELIARMDTDDIARSDRFELQLQEFENDETLDICGSHITEFDDDPNVIVSRRVVPLDDASIKKYQKRRDAFNHMSVMYKKSAVLKAGNYQSCLLMEDTLLWVNMCINNAKMKNIDDYLVNVRVGKDMFKRRGGLKYYKKYKQARKRIYQTGYISWWDYKYTLIVQFIVSIMPNKLRGFVFKKLLHN